ncbi:MAG: ABC transporter permease [Armatimonadota bacterium]
MLRLVLQRLGLAVPTLFAVSFLVFFAASLSPADPVDIMLGERAAVEQKARVRQAFGLDRPPLVRYADYVSGIVTRGDFGKSYFNNNAPVRDVVARGFPNTATLAGLALILSLVTGVPLGIFAAVRANRWPDRVAMGGALVGVAVPSFVLAPVLVLVFAVQRGDLPPNGFALGDASRMSWHFFVLPVGVLAARSTALIARLTRSAMLDVLAQDYIRTARAKGLPERVVLWRHALRNAFPPILTAAGTTFGYLLSGSFVVETFFRIPGIGNQSIDAITRRDYPMIQGLALLMAFGFVVINLATDVLYGVLDPRIRSKGRAK